ncbi:MAG: hypothetical protein KJP17_08985, partial [Gammaproteobacteria bacterium]|nr:hypothetical protein [Gammaproteobacteria bacterium]
MKISRLPGIILSMSALLAAGGGAVAAPPIVAACKACHDVDGSGIGKPYVPVIAGIPAAHIEEALFAYKDGARQCR